MIGPSVNIIQDKGSCKRHFLRMDIYKKPINLRLPDRTDSYRTAIGAALSCATLLLLLAYGAYKL